MAESTNQETDKEQPHITDSDLKNSDERKNLKEMADSFSESEDDSFDSSTISDCSDFD